jgi:glucosylceramidase
MSRPASLFRASAALLTLGLAGAGSAGGQEVRLIRSSAAGERLAEVPAGKFVEAPVPTAPHFKVNEEGQFQRMIGFGASFNEAGMIALNSLEPEKQERVLESLFHVEKGAGLSAMKTVIAGTDFMSAGPFYSYNDTPGDVEMKHFSIARDLEPNGLVPYIKRSQQHGRFILQATMDYPPNWMLVDLNSNQDVDEKYYGALSLYYLRYLEEYRKQGIEIDFLSPFNEPMGYTKIPYRKIGVLIKNHLGPLLHKSGLPTRLQLSDNIDRVTALRDFPEALDDPDVFKYIAGLAYHGYDWRRQPIRPTKENGYGFDEFKAIAELRRRYRTLPVWMTEICHYAGGTPWAKPLPRYEFEDGDWWGHQIFSDLEAGASGWTYWNMILDQNGGPWLVSIVHGNPQNNAQQPLVIINRETKEVSYTGVYYYLAHFSRYVRPTSTRIGTPGAVEGVRCLAFRHTDGRLVAQVMNSNPTETKTTLYWKGRALELVLPPLSLTTCLWQGAN